MFAADNCARAYQVNKHILSIHGDTRVVQYAIDMSIYKFYHHSAIVGYPTFIKSKDFTCHLL